MAAIGIDRNDFRAEVNEQNVIIADVAEQFAT
jgi:hypothetical protein